MAAQQPKKWIIICSPVSGKGKGEEICKGTLMPALEKHGIAHELVVTEYKAHAIEVAKKYAAEDIGIISVGGDGTLHEIMDGLAAMEMLDKVQLGMLSQGTMNGYAVQGGLPSAETIADVIKEGCSRTAPLMIVTDEKDSNLMCFQAVYLGVGYKPAKGAQEWRSTMGPFFGIMYNLIKACIWPSVAQVTGSLIMEKTDGEKVVVKDSFYWVIITHASPYNGVLTDDLWVSYMKLDEFPGFGRTMEYFKPTMEFWSGTAGLFGHHEKVKSVTFEQEAGEIGVCLDGEPIELGTKMTITNKEKAWRVVQNGLPDNVIASLNLHQSPLDFHRGDVPEIAKEWLKANPPPEGVQVTTAESGAAAVAALKAEGAPAADRA